MKNLIESPDTLNIDYKECDQHATYKLKILNKSWQYRGEGNANLVLSIPQERKIVRLHKSDGKIEEYGFETECERVRREVLFCQKVMIPLLGNSFIQCPIAALIDKREIQQLNRILQKQRPATRTHKQLVVGHATVYPDYALLPLHLSSVLHESPVFCVEIKPKQGWIAPPDRRTFKCTFCLNQYLKIKNGMVKQRSHYCPLDLFSGNSVRMKKALKSLLAAPQNNLKIFRNGILIYGEDNTETLEEVLCEWLSDSHRYADINGLIDRFCSLVLQALTKELRSKEDTVFTYSVPNEQSLNEKDNLTPNSAHIPKCLSVIVNQCLPEPSCDWTTNDLPSDCILKRILEVQKLDKYGTDAARRTYDYNYKSESACDYKYVNDFTKSQCVISPLHCYLLAATAKDCSVMLTFQQMSEVDMLQNCFPPEHILHDKDNDFIFNIGVSDLDPKPASSVLKHCKRDRDVLRACLDVLKIPYSLPDSNGYIQNTL